LGDITGKAYKLLRDQVPYTPGDAWWGPEIAQVRQMVAAGAFRL
jgi:hypothetical protein